MRVPCGCWRGFLSLTYTHSLSVSAHGLILNRVPNVHCAPFVNCVWIVWLTGMGEVSTVPPPGGPMNDLGIVTGRPMSAGASAFGAPQPVDPWQHVHMQGEWHIPRAVQPEESWVRGVLLLSVCVGMCWEL